MGGPRRRVIPKDTKDENGEDHRITTAGPEMFDFTLFGGISIKVPKWWTQKKADTGDDDESSANTDPLAMYHSLIFKVNF